MARRVKEINVDDIANTGVTITIEERGSETWTRSAELAARIANDHEFRRYVRREIHLGRQGTQNFLKVAGVVDEAYGYVTQKYGSEPYFDSGVRQAAAFAVMDELKTRPRKNKGCNDVA